MDEGRQGIAGTQNSEEAKKVVAGIEGRGGLDEPASMLILRPAHREKAAGHQPGGEEWKDIGLRHDNYFI